MRFLRVSNVDRPRDAVIVRFPGSGMAGTFPIQGAVVSSALPPSTAVNVRLFFGTGLWRNYLIRGLPARSLNAAGDVAEAGDFVNNLQVYLGRIVADTWQLRQTVVGDPVNLVAVTMQAGKIHKLQTSAAIPGITDASSIKVELAQGISHTNGRYRYLPPVEAEFTYRVVRRLVTSYGTLVANTGRVRAINYTGQNITRFNVVGTTARETGRPFDSSPGRAPVRRD